MPSALAENNARWRALIASKEAFVNGTGSLEGEYVDGVNPEDVLGLVGDDLDRLAKDGPLITYVVWSYNTPIHWVTIDGDSYTVARPPSKTSTGHRNLCPGYRQTREKETP